MKKILIIRFAFATMFLGSIGLGMWFGIGNPEKIDTIGDWVALIGAGTSGILYAIWEAFKYKEPKAPKPLKKS